MSKSKKYIPEKGDIVWLDFEPQKGKEIKKMRPALILSPKNYNLHGLAIACPITSKIKGYPFEVEIKNDKPGKKTVVDPIYAEGGNVEHSSNGLMMNIDNWIYNADTTLGTS